MSAYPVGLFGFAAGDRVEGIPLRDFFGKRVRWEGSDGCWHSGTVVGVFPHEVTHEPMLTLDYGYGSTFGSAARIAPQVKA